MNKEEMDERKSTLQGKANRSLARSSNILKLASQSSSLISSITFCSVLLNAGICFTNITSLGVSKKDTRQLLTDTPRMTKTPILDRILRVANFTPKLFSLIITSEVYPVADLVT